MEDFKLSDHFSFFELTTTSNTEHLEANRDAARVYLPALGALARFLEVIRDDRPLIVNSAFRYFALNKATAGSSPTSQHPLGQAADIHRPGEDPHKTFTDLLVLLKQKKLSFGQLIDESSDRGYQNFDGTESISRWVHLSLGKDFWKPERCGEVLRKWDEDGKARFEMLESKVNQGA